MTKLLALVLMCFARGADAQPLPPGLQPLAFTFTAEQAPAATKPARDPFDFAVFAYGATAGADWAVTAVCLKVECVPHDPIGLLVFNVENQKAAVPLALAIDVALVVAVRQWLRPNHPTIAQVILYSLSTVRLLILTQRIGDLRRNAVIPPSALR